MIARFEGHIAQYLGDGLLVYFGYPLAHEDDAQRAVRAGLGWLRPLETLNSRLEQDTGVRLAVRLGIHTGVVVVGEMGGGGRQEQLALGETPNIAARLQGLAAPDTVVISAATYRLVRGISRAQELGADAPRRGGAPPGLSRAAESEVQSVSISARPSGLDAAGGSRSRSGAPAERWEQAKAGPGQVVLLSGEAGIGKSRLVQMLKDDVTNASHARMECRGSPYHQHSALYPVIDHLQRLCA